MNNIIDFEGIIACACDDYRMVDKRKKLLVRTVYKLWENHLRELVNDELAKIASIKEAEFAKVLGDSVKAWHERLREKDAECQERIFNWHLDSCPHFGVGYKPKGSCERCWQALKKQEGVK